jgi:hypothetical protein
MKLVSMLFVTALLSVSCASMKGKCCSSESCEKKEKMACCDEKSGKCSDESCKKKS